MDGMHRAVHVPIVRAATRRGDLRIPRTGPTEAFRLLAFGVNWFELPPGTEGKEHDESESGQEEISIVVAGDGHWRVEGEDVAARRGTVIRFDPETTRQAVAGPDGLTFVSVGARRGSYEPRGPF